VTAFGTGGTLKGVARVLKKERSDTRIVVCEPDNSQILGSGISQTRTADGSPADSHPSFRTHVVQGWTPDFIPKLAEDVLTAELIDQFAPINGNDALRLSQELAQKEGIFTGISGGATLAGALAVCESAPEGSTVLCMLPDTGERYMSTPLFYDIAEDMTEEEIEISKSTPSFRFDVQQPAACGIPDEPRQVTPEAEAFVSESVGNGDQPVVMFAFEFCEFSWSVRKMFTECGIPYRSIDLDSVEYQEGDWGGEVRDALGERVSTRTIPQIFVGGEHIGGCTETFDAFNEGRLQELLAANQVAYDRSKSLDPYKLLPTWLQPR
jgi:cysteine synthase A